SDREDSEQKRRHGADVDWDGVLVDTEEGAQREQARPTAEELDESVCFFVDVLENRIQAIPMIFGELSDPFVLHILSNFNRSILRGKIVWIILWPDWSEQLPRCVTPSPQHVYRGLKTTQTLLRLA